MKIKYGKGKTEFGTGVQIKLTPSEVALAIYAYLTAHDVHISGAATITTENGELLTKHKMYVDPNGQVVAKGKMFAGNNMARPSFEPDRVHESKGLEDSCKKDVATLKKLPKKYRIHIMKC